MLPLDIFCFLKKLKVKNRNCPQLTCVWSWSISTRPMLSPALWVQLWHYMTCDNTVTSDMASRCHQWRVVITRCVTITGQWPIIAGPVSGVRFTTGQYGTMFRQSCADHGHHSCDQSQWDCPPGWPWQCADDNAPLGWAGVTSQCVSAN